MYLSLYDRQGEDQVVRKHFEETFLSRVTIDQFDVYSL